MTRSRFGCGVGEKMLLNMLEIRPKEVRLCNLFTIFVVLDINISLPHTGQLFQLIRNNYKRTSANVETFGPL
jgi:hypothetical protein